MEGSAQNFDNLEDLARGCVVGGLCGDAIGAFVEFQDKVSEKEAKDALTLPGGGPHSLGRGQITDDGELMLSLGNALAEGGGILNLDIIAAGYGKWYKSRPFNIGMTTRAATSKVSSDNPAKSMRGGARRSITSQSNGGLMRIMPLCVWCAKLNKKDLIKAVSEETKLTHCNKTAIAVSVVYVYTITYLLTHRGDYQGGYQAAKEFAKEYGNKDVENWIDEVEKGQLPSATDQMGWVKIALCYALYFLKMNLDYFEAMKRMLMKGGDTDTNCCIVGGMLGALHGYEKLPNDIKDTVLKFDPKEVKGISRPEYLVPKKCYEQIMEKILGNLPQELKVVGEETEEEKLDDQ